MRSSRSSTPASSKQNSVSQVGMPTRPGKTSLVAGASSSATPMAGAVSMERRATRLRSKELGLETIATGVVVSDDPGPLRKKRKRVQPKEGGSMSALVEAVVAVGVDLPIRPPHIIPRRISIPVPTSTTIPCTVNDVASTPDKIVIKKAARPVHGNGGLVIDQHGDVIGMAFQRTPNLDIFPISILQTCIEISMKFSRIARPALNVDLRSFELLDVSHQEELELEHNVRDGFIVTKQRALDPWVDHGTADNLHFGLFRPQALGL
ncbi:hypothetical protein ABZP36_010328 [Zizania latifolia]